MNIDITQVGKACLHGLATGIRMFLIKLTSNFFLGTNSGFLNKTAGLITIGAQLPGLYNQTRHLAQHATAILPNSETCKNLNQHAHKLPQATGTMTHAENARKHFLG